MNASEESNQQTRQEDRPRPAGSRSHEVVIEEEHHEGAPEWLISFADNVTLLMGFFVILLAMNMKAYTTGGIGGKEHFAGGTPTSDLPDAQTPSPALLDLSIAIREAFHNPVDLSSNNPNDQPLIRRIFQRAGQSSSRRDGPEGRERDVQSLPPTDYHAPFGSVLFANDSIELSGKARQTVIDVAARTKGLTLVVEVRGHASATEGFRKSDSAMRLAFDRALVVAGVLAENGVDWWQMRLVTCGDNDRRNPFPDSEMADAANARVEIVVSDQVVPEPVPTHPDAARGQGRRP